MGVATSQAGCLYWSQNDNLNQIFERLISKIRIRQDSLTPIQPWDFWMSYLADFGGQSEQRFASVQRNGKGLIGFVIAGWDNTDRISGFVSEDSVALTSCWEEFGDQTSACYPRIYKTLKGANRAVGILRRADGSDWISYSQRIGLILWAHPESQDFPLEEYLCLAQGHRFPGSPRQ